MKHLTILLTMAIALNGLAQFEPQQYPFPYNPDYDGDGMVSMTDFLEILTLFGLEYPDSFYADSTRAVLNLGYLRGDQCLLQAEAAGSDWRVMSELDAIYAAQLVVNSLDCGDHYVWRLPNTRKRLDACYWEGGYDLGLDYTIPNSDSTCAYRVLCEDYMTYYISNTRLCILVTEVKSEVEYESCFSYDLGVMETCVAMKLNDGWKPLPGGSSSSGFFQGFWRNAE